MDERWFDAAGLTGPGGDGTIKVIVHTLNNSGYSCKLAAERKLA